MLATRRYSMTSCRAFIQKHRSGHAGYFVKYRSADSNITVIDKLASSGMVADGARAALSAFYGRAIDHVGTAGGREGYRDLAIVSVVSAALALVAVTVVGTMFGAC